MKRPAPPIPLSPEFEVLVAASRPLTRPDDIAALQAKCALPIDWAKLPRLGRRHGVAPLVAQALLTHAPEVLPRPINGQLKVLLSSNRFTSGFMRSELLRIDQALTDQGIMPCHLKGLALAHQIYAPPDLRAAGDLDIVVPQVQFEQAAGVLRGLGLERAEPAWDLSKRAQRVFSPDSHHQAFRNPAKGIAVELHWALAAPLFLTSEVNQDWLGRATPVSLGGRQVLTLSGETLLAYLLYHGARHAWCSLKWLADVAALLETRLDLDLQIAADMLAVAGWQRALPQAELLLNRLYLRPISPAGQNLLAQHPDSAELAHEALLALVDPAVYTAPKGRGYGLGLLAYLGRLKPDFRFRLSLLIAELLRLERWPYRPLPGRLVWLYPVLRVVVWLWLQLPFARAQARRARAQATAKAAQEFEA